jgi:sterol desaturase/sphingolipid hydroxylase (fatty acid hydroxylase superfamily)
VAGRSLHRVTGLRLAGAFAGGFFLWGLFEYLLHRFAMHHLRGKGIMSREHLEHHVKASWRWSPIFLLSWAGVVLVGWLAWAPLGWAVVDGAFGVGLGLGWTLGYAFYEYQHAIAHLRPPRNRYGTWLRHHHFHHHFGHPMANHGVTSPLWDLVFGTYERPQRVRVPRRLVLPWMLDHDGEMLPDYTDRYVLVGKAASDARLDALDRARAFASVAPTE